MKSPVASAAIQFAASLPPGIRHYAIGDIHGRPDLLASLFDTIQQDDAKREQARTTIVFLGDYVDRGPDSKGVVDWLTGTRQARNLLRRDRSSAAAAPFSFLFLMGNHEHLLLSFLENPAKGHFWLMNGGSETLLSYGLDAAQIRRAMLGGQETMTGLAMAFRERLPAAHLEFFRALEPFYRAGDYFFAHAGVNPDLPLARQREDDLLWIRGKFLKWPGRFGAVVVHGHTPAHEPDDLPNRIGIDTYAFESNKLTAVGLEGSGRWFLST